MINNSRGGTIHTVSGKDIPVRGKAWSLEVRSKPFCAFLHALGAPAGDKPTVSYRVPRWLRSKETPVQLKKAFLASYFGSELSVPAQRRAHPTKYRDPVFKISKVEGLEESGREFIDDIDALLQLFDSGVGSVASSSGNVRTGGDQTRVLAARLKAASRDLMNLYGQLGYAYHKRAEAKARLAYAYLSDQSAFLQRRADALARVRAMAKWPRGRIKAVAEESGIPVSTLYGWRSRAAAADGLKIPAGYPSIEEWIRTSAFDWEAGLVFEEVVAKEPADPPQVYDITTTASSHTFFANGILTGNCPPYNADFDGDEMNLHVLQSEEARAEAKILMKVQEHILSPRFGGPVIGGLHDHITGAFLMTYRDAKFSHDETSYLLSMVGHKTLPKPDMKVKGEPYWSGKALFGTILPEDLSLTFRASIGSRGDEEDAVVVIERGKIIEGVVDENAIGALKGKLVDKIARDYGTERARQFIDEATRFAIATIMLRGFTTGIDDEDIPQEAKNEIADVLERAMDEVAGLVEAYKAGELEQMPGRSLEETLEVEAMKKLGRARDDAGQIASRHLGLENSAVIMARSGARGSMLNLSQMAGSLGQQAVRGERLSRGYWKRTLPHFQPEDLGAEAKGFVRSSYKSGLLPTEYFFHSMGGREGLVDTAVRTSRSGYMQRRLINALEDLKVMEDRTVRNTAQTIIQFRFGEDGVDPMRSIAGDSVDIDDILTDVLGPEAVASTRREARQIAGYGTREKNLAGELEDESAALSDAED